MAELRFDGRVAVVTGAGRGLGRAYALLLGSRGARVVVNDIGGSLAGEGNDAGPAQQVVDEIAAAGSEGVACTESVGTAAGARAIVEAALDSYGRIDILIHNAGNVRRAPLTEMSDDDFQAVLDVHMMGGYRTSRAAFPHMTKAGYGRIVMTSSIAGVYGNLQTVNYSMSKAAMVGLVRVAALEGAEAGIRANAILPAAVTRMSEGLDTSQFPPMDPDLVAPVVAYLSHESCPLTGELVVSAAGRVARAYVAETRGVFRPAWTVEQVADDLDRIMDKADPLEFKLGMSDHLGYSFAVAKAAGEG
jgi:NAD(P)-dependent dehydrogenase (short-subunit alcohol dehydrogenase family)